MPAFFVFVYTNGYIRQTDYFNPCKERRSWHDRQDIEYAHIQSQQLIVLHTGLQ